MTTKTLTITEDAYERLAAIKEESESFTDVINRITGRVSLLSIAGILTEKEADHLEMNVKKIRTRSHQRAERIAKELEDDS
ncbi:antitoxin VapB family protein [Candidatus Woesearchaeota archaeon]|nr:antitoxin VapB family protein [Candidatus Woesearchaeota archaeon]